MPSRFDRTAVEQLLALAVDRLDGDWLLIGGAAAAAWFRDDRVTEDVDLVGMSGTQAERFALMQLATDAGLPVEAVNSAADFFVRKVADWREQLVPLRVGRATIYRPNATLFLLLKLDRLSESDLDDCTRLLAHCATTGEAVDCARVRSRLAALPETADAALGARRAALARTLDAS